MHWFWIPRKQGLPIPTKLTQTPSTAIMTVWSSPWLSLRPHPLPASSPLSCCIRISFNSPSRRSSPPLSLWTRWSFALMSQWRSPSHYPVLSKALAHVSEAPCALYPAATFHLSSHCFLSWLSPVPVMCCPQPLPGGCQSLRLVGESVWFLCISHLVGTWLVFRVGGSGWGGGMWVSCKAQEKSLWELFWNIFFNTNL